MELKSIRFNKYKLFDGVLLDNLGKINVIIGKNNSGKSSLIDVIHAVYDADQYNAIQHEIGEIDVSTLITNEMCREVFSGFASIGQWTPSSYAEKMVGKDIEVIVRYVAKGSIGSSRVEVNSSDPLINELEKYWNSTGIRRIKQLIDNTYIRRMRSERNIVPEEPSLNGLSETGEGASNLIRKILVESSYDEKLIENDLLNALNAIMSPESEYETIKIQQIDTGTNGKWEVYLQEKGQQRVPLSKMGSGLKTIIIILLNLLVMPTIVKKENYIFAFEEIENNLHPALQRRVFNYLYDFAIRENVILYLTTHSHVAINCYFDKEQTSIYHIEKIEGKARVKRIESYLDKARILSDLDVKASDILQSNGIIWVEGPSDRIYIEKWFEVFTDNMFIEGQHYQFLYYGGRLLSHYSAEEDTELISILTTNRNAAIVIDSDKRYRQAPINDTKKRVINEFKSLKMFNWVTKGKEVENYIPVSAVQEMFGTQEIEQCAQYELFPTYIEGYYKSFSNRKVPFANKIVPYITKGNSEKMYDLKNKIEELYHYVGKWNGLDI